MGVAKTWDGLEAVIWELFVAAFVILDKDGRLDFSFLSPTMIPAFPVVSSSSDMSMSSMSLLSFCCSKPLPPFPSPLPEPILELRAWKGDSEPVGDGASSEGEGMGESSRLGNVVFRASNLRFRLLTRLAKALYALATILTSLYCIS